MNSSKPRRAIPDTGLDRRQQEMWVAWHRQHRRQTLDNPKHHKQVEKMEVGSCWAETVDCCDDDWKRESMEVKRQRRYHRSHIRAVVAIEEWS